VARIWAELQNALYDLDATVVRAPTDGRVLHLMLRPGMMAVPLPLRPVMVFRHDEDPVFVGAFLQGAAQRIIPGAHAEVILDAVPGKVFAARVGYIIDGMAQGQLQPTGDLVDPERFIQPGRFAAVIEFEHDLSGYTLPGGASGQVAVYTEHFHHVAIIRKMLLRSKSWLNFLFSDGH
jgi:multidrug resistance efflux pump